MFGEMYGLIRPLALPREQRPLACARSKKALYFAGIL
jgi:hypothetical protein